MVRILIGAVTIIFAMALSATAVAESTVEDVMKYRHSIMESMAGHANALSLIALGKIDQGDFLASHADALASATKELSYLFPEGSSGEDSLALPAIWENPEEFQAAVDKAREAGAALSEAAAGGDSKAVMGAFAALGKSCKGCHEDYREEHDH